MGAFNLKILVTVAILFGGLAVLLASDMHLPGNHQGYEPVQPIAFSHRLHAGDLKIDCLYCHHGAQTSRVAGIPSASVCMNCHKNVTAGYDALLEEKLRAELEAREPKPVVSPELAKLYAALALDEKLEKDPSREATPIEWIRVHNLPDFVYFDHRVHVTRGIACETCHGPVQSMDRVRQESSLSMGWCLDCHRTQPATGGAFDARVFEAHQRLEDHVSTDCASCHF